VTAGAGDPNASCKVSAPRRNGRQCSVACCVRKAKERQATAPPLGYRTQRSTFMRPINLAVAWRQNLPDSIRAVVTLLASRPDCDGFGSNARSQGRPGKMSSGRDSGKQWRGRRRRRRGTTKRICIASEHWGKLWSVTTGGGMHKV
jgi:hypothetical protein